MSVQPSSARRWAPIIAALCCAPSLTACQSGPPTVPVVRLVDRPPPAHLASPCPPAPERPGPGASDTEIALTLADAVAAGEACRRQDAAWRAWAMPAGKVDSK